MGAIGQLCPQCMRKITGDKGSYCTKCGYGFHNAPPIQHQLKPYSILKRRYLVGNVLGEGGFGITYIGYDLVLQLRVAIKEFYPKGYVTREANTTNNLTAYTGKNMQAVYKWRDDFLKEARILAKFDDLPGVVIVRDYFQENNTAYIIQEYLEGKTLSEYAASLGGRIPPEKLLPQIAPVLDALCAVHSEGLIHRDISPQNIMILHDGRMKLLDFGAAREYDLDEEKSFSIMLKHGYAPEEQYRRKGKQGPWTDVYALAGTIYICLTGVKPPEAMERIRQDSLQRPGMLGVALAPYVEQALMKAMSVYAEDRYQKADEFRAALYGTGGAEPENPANDPYGVPGQIPNLDQPVKLNIPEPNPVKIRYKRALIAALGAVCLAALLSVAYLSGRRKNGEEMAALDTVYGEQGTEANAQTANGSMPENEQTKETDESQKEAPKDNTPLIKISDDDKKEETVSDEGKIDSERQREDDADSSQTTQPSPETADDAYHETEEPTAPDRDYGSFQIDSGTVEDYARVLNPEEYQQYNGDENGFTFSFPAGLFNNVDVNNRQGGNDYGQYMQYIHFFGSAGSELVFSKTKRLDNRLVEEIANDIRAQKREEIRDAVELRFVSEADLGRIVITGNRMESDDIVYEVIRIDADYIMQMIFITPPYTSEEDEMQKSYVTESIYRMCGFSGSTKGVRSYQSYKMDQ